MADENHENQETQTEEKLSALQELCRVDPQHLIGVLQGESVHTQSIILSCISEPKAALIIQYLPEQNRLDVLQEIVRGERLPADLLELTAQGILQKVRELEEKNYVSLGGIDYAVSIINLLDRQTEKSVISEIQKRDDEMAEEIKRRIFVFEDIVMLDDRAVQKVLREVDCQELAKALKGMDEAVLNKILSNMSKNAAAMLKEDISYLGAIREKDRDESQMKIVSVIRRLEDAGEIVIARSCGDEMIV